MPQTVICLPCDRVYSDLCELQVRLFVTMCGISPPSRLIISEAEPSTLTCTVSCHNLTNNYLYTPDANSVSRIDIVRDNAFDEIHGEPRTNCTQFNDYSYSVELYWTQDEQIRTKLVSLQCVFIFQRGSSPCITDKISVVFAGMNNNYCPRMAYLVLL